MSTTFDTASHFVTPTDELGAINFLLSTIGQAPVSSLEAEDGEALGIDTEKAIRCLAQVNREVQTEGWNFNEEFDYPFQLDAEGEIQIPETILKIKASRARYQGTVKLTQRGNKLYDLVNRTTVFSATIYCDVRWLLAFEDLPEAARQYITIKAARRFSDQETVSDTGHKFTQTDETRARVTMEASDADDSQFNPLRDNPHFREMMREGRSYMRRHR